MKPENFTLPSLHEFLCNNMEFWIDNPNGSAIGDTFHFADKNSENTTLRKITAVKKDAIRGRTTLEYGAKEIIRLLKENPCTTKKWYQDFNELPKNENDWYSHFYNYLRKFHEDPNFRNSSD